MFCAVGPGMPDPGVARGPAEFLNAACTAMMADAKAFGSAIPGKYVRKHGKRHVLHCSRGKEKTRNASEQGVQRRAHAIMTRVCLTNVVARCDGNDTSAELDAVAEVVRGAAGRAGLRVEGIEVAHRHVVGDRQTAALGVRVVGLQTILVHHDIRTRLELIVPAEEVTH